jgi:hypothetical protein
LRRHLTLWIGAGGVLVLLFVVGLMRVVVRNEDLAKAPPPVDEQTQTEKEKIFRDEPKEEESSKAAQPEKAPKQPPLNQ